MAKTLSVAETYAKRISKRVLGRVCYSRIGPGADAWTVYDPTNSISYDCYNDGVNVRFPWADKRCGVAHMRQVAIAAKVLAAEKLVDL